MINFSLVPVFPHVLKMTKALLAHEIDGALVDNYVITHSLNLIQEEPIRIERYIDHKITYGVVLAQNSSKFETCLRRFLHNNPQEIFEMIAANLVPLKVRHFWSNDWEVDKRKNPWASNFPRKYLYFKSVIHQYLFNWFVLLTLMGVHAT